MFLISLRGTIPDFFSIIAANTFIVASAGFTALGLDIFFNVKKRINFYLSVIGFVLFFCAFFLYSSESTNMRIAAVSLGLMIFYIRCSYILIKNFFKLFNSQEHFLVFVFSYQVLWLFYRILSSIWIQGPIQDFMKAPVTECLSFLVFISGFILNSFGLIILNFRRVEYDLLKSYEEIKVLKGIIPICCVCKKIRNDDGIWKQLEKYLSENSDAEFSHGICPECLDTHYSEDFENE
jgi:hypothetical protein